MKLTARTISTASISVPTNSLTEPETTLAWSWNWCSSRPAGSSARISALAACSALPRTMMSPPRAIEMPSAITGLPWSRTFTCGGSTVPRLISAMSPSLKAAPPARIGKQPQLLERVELAGDADLDRIARQVDRAARLDRVLLAELGEDLVEVEAELGEPALRDLDEDLLVLGAEDRDLADVLHLQQALAHPVGVVLQLGVAEAVGRERVDRAVDVAELVVEERPAHARRAACRACRRSSSSPCTRSAASPSAATSRAPGTGSAPRPAWSSCGCGRRKALPAASSRACR